jgi:hypothetical protein
MPSLKTSKCATPTDLFKAGRKAARFTGPVPGGPYMTEVAHFHYAEESFQMCWGASEVPYRRAFVRGYRSEQAKLKRK